MTNEKPELNTDEITLIKLAKEFCADETKARALLEAWRWPNGPVCAHCNNDGKQKPNSKLTPRTKTGGVRQGVYFCGACRKQFTVTVNSIFEGSHIPISTWLQAIFLMCSSKKGISSHQIHRMLDVTYKTAWFLTHRIRYAMQPEMPLGKLLTGTVEVDETFVGGKGDRRTKRQRHTPVVALVERDGNIQTRVVADVTQKNLRAAIGECVDKGAIINTDESGVYRGQLKDYAGHHHVNHSEKEYCTVLPDGGLAHVNTCESFFSLLKRGVHGAWHHVSREHLPKYAAEFAFRWNSRDITDGERMLKAIKMTGGKKLSYMPLTSLGAKKAPSERKTETEKPRRIFRGPPPF